MRYLPDWCLQAKETEFITQQSQRWHRLQSVEGDPQQIGEHARCMMSLFCPDRHKLFAGWQSCNVTPQVVSARQGEVNLLVRK